MSIRISCARMPDNGSEVPPQKPMTWLPLSEKRTARSGEDRIPPPIQKKIGEPARGLKKGGVCRHIESSAMQDAPGRTAQAARSASNERSSGGRVIS